MRKIKANGQRMIGTGILELAAEMLNKNILNYKTL